MYVYVCIYIYILYTYQYRRFHINEIGDSENPGLARRRFLQRTLRPNNIYNYTYTNWCVVALIEQKVKRLTKRGNTSGNTRRQQTPLQSTACPCNVLATCQASVH